MFPGSGRRLTRPLPPGPDKQICLREKSPGLGLVRPRLWKEGPRTGPRSGILLCPQVITLLPHASCSTQRSLGHPDTRKAALTTFARPDSQKNTWIDKKCAAGSVSRRGRGRWSQKRTLRSLWSPYEPATPSLQEWASSGRTRSPWMRDTRRAVHRRTERRIVAMTMEIHEQTLWLIPVCIAVSFMVWVLWSWWREERHSSARSELIHPARPAPSSEAPVWRR